MIFKKNKILCLFLFAFLFLFSVQSSVLAEKIEENEIPEDYYYFPEDRVIQKQEYYRGKVIDISEEKIEEIVEGYREKIKIIKVKLEDDRVIDIEHIMVEGREQGINYDIGDAVVVSNHITYGEEVFYIYDYDRTKGLVIIFLFFIFIIL